MRVYLGADHRGYETKELVKNWLEENGIEVEDVGAYFLDPEDDYVDIAIKVGELIEGSEAHDRGVLLCGSGHGVDIVANKFKRVRAIIAFNDEVVVQGREHEDANVLVLPADWMSSEEACERVRIFLETEKLNNTRHVRRRNRIENLNIR